MSQVHLEVDGRTYIANCADGQEGHLHYLTGMVNKKLQFVKAHLRPDGESHALFLAALLLADDLSDLTRRNLGMPVPKDAQDIERAQALASEADKKLNELVAFAENLAKVLTRSRKNVQVAFKSLSASEQADDNLKKSEAESDPGEGSRKPL